MHHLKTIEGMLDAKGLNFAIVAARFNDIMVDRLVGGAVDYLMRHGAERERITLVRVPGAFELPLAAKRLAEKGGVNAVICLGAIIRGSTPHFDFVASECSKGLAAVMMEHGIPVGFGVLTCDSLEQAIERSGSKAGNKGVEAAAAALEMVRVMEQI
ncbi:6,7-dimethyl-8-ribityllumazine synthase [Alkalidesulfovibrio alkalitolerans DSM 16529]|jgi:6,7-dimethyl-8-ribityllumazine synthase|uniref:6,7-dimethyl-8-ribityllumazine synthase n=1 Tax=Alkalidesulfovibrio alkalitolerans DSM 16529 TaxID=1121439 RepID=S7T910_9BACT|nr:6,7-dimethyl-8-ribityllumazine synthase [Alkalidesulfovibrio alkalitolerans]EPR33015.1 6,7-dimethyl-8-ribityllumazine synthase [Alkalidesulfovibrio alkalitolerans DSM 16529]